MALITTAEAKQQIPSLSGTGEDSLLTVLISVAGGMIADACGYPAASSGAAPTLEDATYTLILDAPGGRDLVLPVWPVVSVTSIYDDETGDFEDSTTLVTSTDYTLVEPGRGRVKLKSSAVSRSTWTRGRGHIKATFVAGFETVPDPVKHACRLLVRHLWDLRQTQGKTNQSAGGGRVDFREAAALPAEVLQILGPYNLPASVIG